MNRLPADNSYRKSRLICFFFLKEAQIEKKKLSAVHCRSRFRNDNIKLMPMFNTKVSIELGKLFL